MRRARLASLIGQMTRNVAAKNDLHLVYKTVLGKKDKEEKLLSAGFDSETKEV